MGTWESDYESSNWCCLVTLLRHLRFLVKHLIDSKQLELEVSDPAVNVEKQTPKITVLYLEGIIFRISGIMIIGSGGGFGCFWLEKRTLFRVGMANVFIFVCLLCGIRPNGCVAGTRRDQRK